MNHLRQRLFVRALEDRTVPALFTVTNLNDSGAGTLRQAVLSANGAAGADTIDFSVALPGTIFLTSGELAITGTSALTITGPGPGLLAVSGNNSSRIFNMTNAAAGMAISISGLELTAAKSTGQGGAILGDNQNLTLTNCRLTLNKITTTFGGAAVAMTAGGNFTATDCLFSGNSVGGFGGALNLFGNGTNATFTRCTISGNSAFAGGGLYVSGDLLINECTVSGNSASAFGGGMRLSNYYDATAAFTIRNSTISGNNGAEAGGIALTDFATTLTVQNSTLTENSTAGTGGGIRRISGAGGIILESTIVSGNTAATHPDVSCTGSVSMNFCAVGSNSGFTMTDKGGNLPFQPHTNLKLGLLLNNGGPTQTHRVAVDSPCVDSGNNPLSLTTDQRGTGFPRQVGKAVDIGAFELKPFVVTNLNDSGAGSLRQAAIDANGVAGQDVIEFAPGLTGIITLTSGEIALNEGVTIDGPGADVLTVNANKASRIFNTSGAPNTSLAVISIEGLTFTGGSVNAPGGAILGADETLAVTSCVFTGNSAKSGGAIALTTGGHFSAVFSRFIGNSASVIAGAITIEGVGSQAVIGACTISGNSAPQAGGLYARDNLRVGESTISGNTATNGAGGGIMAGGTFAPTTLQILNSTVSGNSAKFNGGGIILINFTGELPLQNSTVTNNTAGGPGGGISVANGPGTIAVESSIVFGNVNAAAPDISSANKVSVKTSVLSSSIGFNETDLGGNLPVGIDIKLGPLADNGGLTFTQQPAPDSPLIDAGSNPTARITDQRGSGFQRVIGENIDIGAFEVLNLVVRTTADAGIGSLRQTILHANSHPGLDQITFDTGVFGAAKTIVLNSELVISGETTITGPGTNLVTINGNSNRIFQTSTAPAGTQITLTGMTLTGGVADQGGAIFGEDENLTLNSCIFTANKVQSHGGAVRMGPDGKVSATNCSFTNNGIVTGNAGYGGAIFAYHLELRTSTVSGNSSGTGGGISVGITPSLVPISLTMEDSTIEGNTAALEGGGLVLRGSVSGSSCAIRNCTISGNISFVVGGFFTGVAVVVSNSTITRNSASGDCGGVYVSGAGLALESTIIAQNVADFAADISSSGSVLANNSIVGVADQGGFSLIGAGNSTGTAAAPRDAKLGPLADNGGPTLTHLPLNGSPAINAGNNKAGLVFDQRGSPRAVGVPDVGAVELQPQVTNLAVSTKLVSDANVGPDGFTVTMDYSVPMNIAVLPAVAFPVEVPAGSITFSSGAWTDLDTYAAKFTVADLGTALANIDIQVSGGKDAFSNAVQLPFTLADVFSLDTLNPNLTAITSTSPNGTYGAGQSVNVTLNFSEAVTLAGTLNVTLDTGAVVAITGPATGVFLSGTYIIGAGQNSPDLNVTALALSSGGTLRDIATNNAVFSLPALNLANTANIVVSTPAGVSGFVVNDGDAQRSRLTKVVVNFSSLMNAATLAGPGGVTFTRTAGTPNGTVVDTSNGLSIFPASGMVSSVTLTFANVINAGVESGSLADGRWQLAIPTAGFTSVFNELNIFRFFGDADGDGSVAANDFIQFRLALGGSTAMFDFDNDGAVAASDFIQFRLRFGGSI